MTERIVFKVTEYSCNVQGFQEFAKQMTVYGIGRKTEVKFHLDENGTGRFVVEIPQRSSAARAKLLRSPRTTKAQEAVRSQLEARREAVRSGEAVSGYVPAVKGVKRSFRKRKKT